MSWILQGNGDRSGADPGLIEPDAYKILRGRGGPFFKKKELKNYD